MKALQSSIVTTALLLCGLPLAAQTPGNVDATSNQPAVISSSQPLPDAPQDQNKVDSKEQKQQQKDKISPSGQLPFILSPQMTQTPLTPHDKFRLYAYQAFGPLSLVFPAFAAGLRMAIPPNHYPPEWRDGADGFGRNYGDSLARMESESAAKFLVGVIAQEDPRYAPAASTHVPGRVTHALAFALVDRSDAGLKMPALGNFAGAAASGFVGMAYLPDGYNDLTHAGQRGLLTLASYGGFNIINEFCPEWAPLVKKAHIPFIHPTCVGKVKASNP